MKHINPNMVAPVLAGIEVGERLVGEAGEHVIDALIADAERLSNLLAAQVTARILPSKELAYAQGAIAAYRASTEYHECGEGQLYATGVQCRETGTWETRCTGCNHHDY